MIDTSHTPDYLYEKGYLNFRDVQAALGLSRSGVYEFFKRVGVKPHSMRIGVKVYYALEDLNAALERVQNVPRQRRPKKRKKPEYCTQNNGDCDTCSLVSYGMDCRNNPIEAKEVTHGKSEKKR